MKRYKNDPKKSFTHYHSKFLFCFLFIITSPVIYAAKFSIVVIPDSQWYTETAPEIFEAQTQWVVDNRIKENIIYVSQLGDLKDNQNCNNSIVPDGRTEWQVVDDAMATLEDPVTTGLPDGIPYGLLPGNHDFDQLAGSCPNYDDERPLVNYNATVGSARYAGKSFYGGSFAVADNEHNYTLFEFCGIKFIAINLAYHENASPLPVGDPALLWADNLLSSNLDRIGIVTSHFFLEEHTSGDPTNYGSFGANVYDALSSNPNLYMMLAAHRRGEAWRVESRAGMPDVHVLMSNYQDIQYPAGGAIDFANLNSAQPGNSGFMRIMRFDTDTGIVEVESFAPAVPSLGRLTDLVSSNDVVSGNAMDRFSVSNFTLPFTSPSLNPSIAILLDTSGSMLWGVDGTFAVPVDEQRITFAKESAKALLELMIAVPDNENLSSFGIATFPDHPSSSCAAPNGEVITALTPANVINVNTATDLGGTIDSDADLAPSGFTPLLAGLETARSMFAVSDQCRSVILLSDGYHNCPTNIDSTDPVVDALINNLNADNIRVYSVGFGVPGDVDNLLHKRLADDTTPAGASSQFYDVTADLMYNPAVPASWDAIAKPSLDSVFKEIISSALGLETAIDPIDNIASGQTKTYFVAVNECDRKVGVYLSWRSLQKNALLMKVFDSNGDRVNPGAPGVKVLTGTTYSMLSVDKKYLDKDTRVGINPWRIEISRDKGATSKQEIFQYSVLMDSVLKLHPLLAKKDYFAGDKIEITAQLTEQGKPIKGLNNVEVIISAPSEGKGNWLSKNPVSTSQLSKIPMTKGKEPLLPFQRKVIFLTEVDNKPYPKKLSSIRVKLYDDGSHGDIKSDDGKYSNQFINTNKEGIYSFYFKANGPTGAGKMFNREQLIQKYLPVKPDALTTRFELEKLSVYRTSRKFTFKIQPKDKIGNYLGPGHKGLIKINSTHGKMIENAVDNLDGSYSQTLSLPLKTNIHDVYIKLRIGTAIKKINLSKLKIIEQTKTNQNFINKTKI